MHAHAQRLSQTVGGKLIQIAQPVDKNDYTEFSMHRMFLFFCEIVYSSRFLRVDSQRCCHELYIFCVPKHCILLACKFSNAVAKKLWIRSEWF